MRIFFYPSLEYTAVRVIRQYNVVYIIINEFYYHFGNPCCIHDMIHVLTVPFNVNNSTT